MAMMLQQTALTPALSHRMGEGGPREAGPGAGMRCDMQMENLSL
jgi:hypothetical protein